LDHGQGSGISQNVASFLDKVRYGVHRIIQLAAKQKTALVSTLARRIMPVIELNLAPNVPSIVVNIAQSQKVDAMAYVTKG
jgi:hypothetical protein